MTTAHPTVNWKELDDEDSARILAILFRFKQTRIAATVHEPDDPSLTCLPLDEMMQCFSEIKNRNPALAALQPVMALARLVIDSQDEWRQLAQLRTTKPLWDWYKNDYLKSSLWAGLREIVFHRDNRECTLCSARATSVHHVSYDEPAMTGYDIRYLWSICRGCHSEIEFDDGRKLSIFESTAKFKRIYYSRFKPLSEVAISE